MLRHLYIINSMENAAGLQSHQFNREQNRFGSFNEPIQKDNLPRQPRTGNNTRNNSNIVFKFGQNLGYKNGI